MKLWQSRLRNIIFIRVSATSTDKFVYYHISGTSAFADNTRSAFELVTTVNSAKPRCTSDRRLVSHDTTE